MKRLASNSDETMTYYNTLGKNIGKDRRNHILYRRNDESVQEFIARNSLKFEIDPNSNIPIEIQYLNKGIEELDREMSILDYNEITIKTVGGYASCHLTNQATADIDSIERIDSKIKDLANNIAERSNGYLEENWLNDEISTYCGGDQISNHMIRFLQNHNECFFEDDSNLGNLQKITIMKANPEAILCMKLGAIKSRSKEKDISDFRKIVQSQSWSVNDIWNICRKFKISQFMEKGELASDLFFVGLITEKEFAELLRS